METKLLKESEIAVAGKILRDGGLVAFRTETVYGLGADATSEAAIQKIYKAKNRPAGNPLIVHFSDINHIDEYFLVPDTERLLLQIKSLTVLLPLKCLQKELAKSVTGGNPSVAVRIPCCGFSRKLIKAAGVPIAAPSANTSTRPSPTKWEAVQEDLDGAIDAIVMGGQTKKGVESTVVKHSGGRLFILRQGAVDLADLEKKTGLEVEIATNKTELKQSPGARFKHYAPSYPAVMASISGGAVSMALRIARSLKQEPAVVICHSSHRKFYDSDNVIALGKNARCVKKNFYDSLRVAEKVCKERGIGRIIIEEMPPDSKYDTLRERIKKATEGNEI